MRSGGTTGNARLTALTGVVLLVALAVEGATLLSLRSFLSVHILLGLALIPLIALKLASTGWKMVRYYLRVPVWVELGPPALLLRLLGPVVALSTVGLFGTGVALIALGPSHGLVLLLHKASFVVWVAAMTLHVLGHLGRLPRLVVPDLRGGAGIPGSRLRLALVAAVVVIGAVLAVAVAPSADGWLDHQNGFPDPG